MKRLSSCLQCQRAFSRGRKGQKYCSKQCANRAAYLDTFALNENQGGSRTPDGTVADTNSSARVKLTPTKSRCPNCGQLTGQDFVDVLTPVMHVDCPPLVDRTHLFPDVYGPNPTRSIYTATLG